MGGQCLININFIIALFGLLARYFIGSMADELNYVQELALEKDNLDPSFVHAQRLLSQGEFLPLSKFQA